MPLQAATTENNHSQNSYRTLNVRDALSYLEQVKVRFQDQNEVYNQFLDVMKLFKTQSIDTPGVIERVSTLFRGYPSLIQGFNTFLPPGFRIECSLVRQTPPNNQEADLVTFYTPGEITHKTSLFPRDRGPAIILTNHPIGSLPPGWIHVSTDSQSTSSKNSVRPESPSQRSNLQSSSTDQPTALSSPTEQIQPNLPASSKPSNSSNKPSKSSLDSSHNDAPNLAIKAITNQRTTSPLRQDQPRPRSQNSNLLTPAQAPSKNQGNHEPISKSTSRNRKTNACPTNPGSLSRGPSPSLDGFVPTPIVSTRGSTPSNEFPINSRPSHSVPTSQPPTSGQNYSIESNNSKLPIAPDLTKTDSSHKFSQHHSSQAHKPPAPPARSNSTLPLPPQSAAIQLQPAPNALLNNSKPVEFNYAINYVNKIKHRFIDQPEIYKTFLEILQTYQRDGMPIDSVYVKVTKLFSNAADLLDEFKQFLPDLNASTATGQVPKYMFPPPAKTSSASKAIPHTPSGSSTKPNHDQLTNPSHRVTSDALTQRQSQSSLQNNSSTDPLHDSSRHPHKKISPTRSQSHGKVSSIFACVASPDLPMVLDPQVLSSTSSHALDPQVVNHAHSCAKLPAPIGTPSTSLSNNGFITNDLPSHSKTSTSHAISSTLPDSFPLHQKRLLPSHANSILPDDKPSEPPRKKRAFGGPLKNSSQEVAGLTLTKDLNNLTADCDVAAFPTEGLTAKKARRSKSKNASTDSVNPTVPHEPAPHKIPTLPEQHRSSQLHSHKELESSPHKIIGSSDQYRPPSNTLPYQVIDGHSGHPKLQLVQDPHLGSSALTDYSIWQPMYIETHDAMGGRTLTNTKELMLFESIKKYLNDQELWLEFLRVLDLYNQSIIDFKTLVDRVSVFIGDDDELLEDFKGLVGYDVKNDGLVEGEVWEIKNRDIKERDKVDASTIQKEYGPSYKRLPRVEIDLACSGRDELCWSVLNDEYFGAAKFGTESGGPGHRKTNFEEVIAMTEGERAHFSYWLECISRTIGHFESLQAYLNKMEDQDKANFNLGDNLGGISPSIYHRTLRKVYEAKYQTSILPYLRDYPINTIPIVLHRLKELELSWKSAESQWNLIWREVERKNYYRAQDHQVVGFKSAEKSLLKGQNLLKEIQDLKNNNQETLIYTVSLNEEEDVNGEGNPKTLQNLSDESSPDGKLSITLENKIPEKIIRSPSPSRASHQIELGFQDMKAFFDVLRIVIMALDRSTLSNPERRRIDDSIRTFIPAIWNISSSELEKQIPIIYDDESSGGEHSEEGGGHANQSTQNGRGGQTPTMDQEHKQNLLDQRGIQTLTEGLLKIQQTTQQESSSEQRRSTRSHNLDTPMSSPSHSYQLTPAEYVSSNNHLAPTCAQHLHPAPKACSTFNNNNENELNQTSFTGLKKWTKIAIPADPPHHPGNSTDQKPQRPVDSKVAKWYNVFGTPTYYLLIRLLHTLYSRLLKLKTIGKKLSHEKRRWRRINPVAIELGLSHPIIGLDDHPYPSTQLYPYCLDQLSRYFDGEIDFNSFEESIRVAFPKHGYLLSTVDKLTNSILKQFAQIHQEPKNRELLNLLKRERNLNSNESIVQISYRNQAESIVRTVDGDREEMFIRAEWHPDRMSLSVQILNEDDPTFEMTDPVDRLNHYIDTFEFDIDSALVQHSKVRKPFLRANLALINHATDEDRDDEDDDDIDNNSKDETNQSLTNGTIKRGKKEENEDKIKHEMNSITTGDPPLLDQIPDDIVLKEQKMKNNAKPRRLIIVNQSNIQLSIDPKTHKLKFNNRYHNSMIRDQDQPRRKEPTDLLFVKNFNSSSPALNVTATVPNNQIDNNNCFKSTHMDSERVRKFESWLINWYQGTSD